MDPTENDQSSIPPLHSIAENSTFAKRFQLRELLGRGGSSAVYRARDLLTDDTEVALKLSTGYQSTAAADRTRFTTEAAILHEISHPNIVRIYGYGVGEEGIPYLSMELVEGITLDRWVTESRPSVEQKIHVLTQLAGALATLHRAKLVHRDLKPSNILVMEDGVLKLVDFGIATGGHHEGGNTLTGELLGTPAFMAPEQCIGAAASSRSDIFAFGLIAASVFELPLPQPTLAVHRRDEETAVLLQKLASSRQIPAGLKRTVRRCLERDYRKRPADGIELLDLLTLRNSLLSRSTVPLIRTGSRIGATLIFVAVVIFTLCRIDSRAQPVAVSIFLRAAAPFAVFGFEPMTLPPLLGLNTEHAIILLGKISDFTGIRTLLESNPAFQFEQDPTALWFAVDEGDPDLVRLLAPHSNAEIQDPHSTLIADAIVKAKWESIIPLLDHGMKTTELPLDRFMTLVFGCRTEIAMRVIESGFDPMRELPVDGERRRRSVEIGGNACPGLLSRLVRKYPANRWPEDSQGISGLAAATINRSYDALPILRRHGVDLTDFSAVRRPLMDHVLGLSDGDARFARAFLQLTPVEKKRLLEFRRIFPNALGVEQVESATLLSASGAVGDVPIDYLLSYVAAVQFRRERLTAHMRQFRWGTENPTPAMLEEGREASGTMLAMLLTRKEVESISIQSLSTSFFIAEANSCAPCLRAFLNSTQLSGLLGSIDGVQLLFTAGMYPEVITLDMSVVRAIMAAPGERRDRNA